MESETESEEPTEFSGMKAMVAWRERVANKKSPAEAVESYCLHHPKVKAELAALRERVSEITNLLADAEHRAGRAEARAAKAERERDDAIERDSRRLDWFDRNPSAVCRTTTGEWCAPMAPDCPRFDTIREAIDAAQELEE